MGVKKETHMKDRHACVIVAGPYRNYEGVVCTCDADGDVFVLLPRRQGLIVVPHDSVSLLYRV